MDEEYVEAVLTLVEQVPAGRVTTYGALARAVGVGSPRQVGRVMALHGDAVPWWRVVHADGRPAICHDGTAIEYLREDGVPLTNSGRVDLASGGTSTERAQSAASGTTSSARQKRPKGSHFLVLGPY
jgi:alkylated DNA nucleotide flippase Atl1